MRSVGSYWLVAELDDSAADMRRFLGVSSESPNQGALLEVAPDALAAAPSYGVRFQAEGQRSARLTGPAAVEFLSAGSLPRPWRAYRYVPSIPLWEALALSGGALPTTAVLRLGARAARTLALAHSNGLVHAGISPASVAVGYGGPLLLGFGGVRAATSEGQPRGGCPGVVESSLPPEQARGDAPQPLGDIYALGMVLAFAATGNVPGQVDELPSPLREIVARCTAADPNARPQAATLTRELVEEPSGEWLPHAVTAAIQEQETAVRTAVEEIGQRHEAGAPSTVPSASDPRKRTTGRRRLLLGAAVGAAGVFLGGVSAYATNRQDGTSQRGGEPAPKGAAPEPLWSCGLPFKANETDMLRPPVVWDDRVAVYAAGRTLVGVDLGDGTRRWSAKGLWSRGTLQLLGEGSMLVPGKTPKVVSAESGEVEWTVSDYKRGKSTEFVAPLGSSGDVFWFLARRDGGRRDGEFEVVAYDVGERAELWRAPLTRPALGALHRQGDLLLVPEGEDALAALSLSSGKRRWTQKYPGVSWEMGGPAATTVPGGLLAVSMGAKLHLFDARTAEKRWTFEREGSQPFGAAVHRDGVLYVMNGDAAVYAVEVRTGRWKWQGGSRLQHTSSLSQPPVMLSTSGDTLITSPSSTVDAYRTDTGEVLWHFTSLGGAEDKGVSGVANGLAAGKVLVHNAGVVHALPVD